MYIGELSNEIDNKFDFKNDSKFGGEPIWINDKEPTNLDLKCSICKKDFTFLFQLSTSYDEYIRVIYLFCCMNSSKCNMNKNNWVCIKGKKKLVHELTNNDIQKNNNMDESKNMEKKNTDNLIYNNNYKGNNTFSIFSNENTKKEDSILENLNSREEKLIDWNSLFSKKTIDNKKSSSSLFSNSLNEGLNYVKEKYKNDHDTNKYNNTNINNECFNKHINCDIIKSNNVYNNKKELDTCNDITLETLKSTNCNNYHLPCYYISLIEDDEECGKDYLYEKAKKMYEMYENNKNNMEDDDYLYKENDNDNDDVNIDNNNEEGFENDLNGCVKFYSYLSKNYNQILRYSYNGKFLYMFKSTKTNIKQKNMTCSHCKHKLLFELQLFSTFIYQIEKKLEQKKNHFLKKFINNFNVGNIIIFTCEQDCVSIDDMYSYEHIELEIF
ncbi:conserved Plasmodium protein, unknown function [Plasmodium gaboni]|uniref:Programmed cell death protein 2 C-terminal domain-containing protein n=1 Tax=Plasmodium gaboni TaxID=647221 RepID=A0ABY1UII4_9APIC|nr:conserved Plasmodium protein, unknown function [Plasmodium gaboni]